MYWTLGMILKMSLVYIQYGGIKEDFIAVKKIYPSCPNQIGSIGVNTDDWVKTHLCLFYANSCMTSMTSVIN